MRGKMFLTPAECNAALEHVIGTVFDLYPDSPLYLSLKREGITDIRDILWMHASDINVLAYHDAHGNEVPLHELYAYSLRVIICYMQHHVVFGGLPMCDISASFTINEFANFRVGRIYADMHCNGNIYRAQSIAEEYDAFLNIPDYIARMGHAARVLGADFSGASPSPCRRRRCRAYLAGCLPMGDVTRLADPATLHS
jgi:hypothetical protein